MNSLHSLRKPTHPGIYFKEEIQKVRGISIPECADSLGITESDLTSFLNGQTPCVPEMARRLAESTGTGVGIWINMQAKLDIWAAENMEMPSNVSVLPQARCT